MKGGATIVTRTINEWVQKTAVGIEYMIFISGAVLASGSDHSQGCASAMDYANGCTTSSDCQSTLKKTFPLQMTVVEATMRAELRNSRLPERVQFLAIQKNAATVSDLLSLTFQTYLPSGPAATVNGLISIEAPVKPARTLAMKVICNDQTFMETLNILEIEMTSRAHEDDEERRDSQSRRMHD